MKKVVIIGGNGQLGIDLVQAFSDVEAIPLTHPDIEISDHKTVSGVLSVFRPDLVINTAAYHKVDDCEKNPEQSYRINALGSLNLAKVTEELGIPLVHVSTDYVFDGKKGSPYVETDAPHPLNVYAVTKLAGEHLIAANSSRYYIVRSSGLYGHNPCRAKGRNFIDTMLKLSKERKEIRVVNDEVLTPTFTRHLAIQIRRLVDTGTYGLYHCTNNGSCSWYEFAQEIFRLAGVAVPVVPVSAREFPSTVKRPPYSVLDNAALRSLGIDTMPQWRESLAQYFSGKA